MRDLVGDDGQRITDFMLGVLEYETERTETPEWFTAEIRRLSEIRRRSAAASEP